MSSWVGQILQTVGSGHPGCQCFLNLLHRDRDRGVAVSLVSLIL